ncbi:hypothetical protein BGX27_009402 [Mortierella sp. AM989]|nr:hypothetical protein BGX27_009402 [Mortierella sp. AM989]
MTTSSASEPETENTHSTGPSMDRKASSPRLDASSPSVSIPFTLLALPSTDASSSLGAKASDSLEDTVNRGDGTTFSELEQDSTQMTSRSSLDSTPTSLLFGSPSTSISLGTQDNIEVSSIGQQDATSYVLNGTHDGHKATAPIEIHRSRRASHTRQKQQQQQHETETKEMAISVLVDCNVEENYHNAITTPTSISPTTSFNLENSSITNVDVEMSMISPNRGAKSSLTSTSSSVSTGRRKIAESSMRLSAGTLPAAISVAAGGSLSPAWSMTSIPRDISASYNQNHLEQNELFAAGLVDEELYGLVDRYGFLVEEGRTPIADKSTTQASSSQRSVRAINESKTQAKVIEKEQERSLKWTRMARQYTSEAKETEYMFPNNSKVFQTVGGRQHAFKTIDGITLSWDKYIPDMLEISSSEEEQIDLDIPRTMHGHIMFRTRYGPGQCSLFNVLKAYSNYNHQVGYCQGMASIVATMLTFFDEEKTFILLVQLFERYNINNLVIPGFPALFEAFFIQEELTKIYAPKVFEALETMGIATPSYASRWYITLYSAGVVPYRTLLRIWDIFLLEGFDWLYFMALALLKYHESALIQNNFERTMEMLNAKMDIQDDNKLLRIAKKLFNQARKTGIVAKLKEKYAANQVPTATSEAPSTS